jgi:hypothetical protein
LALYWILGALAVVVLVVTFLARGQGIELGPGRDRRKPPRTIGVPALGGLILLVLLLLGGAIWLVDYLVVTDEERIVDAIQEMAEGARTRDAERILRHISEDFQGPPGGNKKGFEQLIRHHIEHSGVTDLVVWDFSFPEDSNQQTATTKNVLFYAKVKGSMLGGTELFYLVDATFRLDGDKRWRLERFLLKNPAVPTDILPVPY